MSAAALFVDRDGVINIDKGHVHRFEDFEWMPGIVETLRTAESLSLKIVVVTNQAGIGKGLYTEGQFLDLSAWMRSCLSEQGVSIAAIYYCPFHPDGRPPYRGESVMRKPGPGMLLRAAEEHDLELDMSLMIGDQETDVLAARAAGLGAVAKFDPNGGVNTGADAVLRDHEEASRWLQATVARLRRGGKANG